MTSADRAALLRHGVVVVSDEDADGCLEVVGASEHRVRELVARRLGPVDVDVIGPLPRRLEPRRCVGHMEREAGRLQLRYVLRGDEHVDDIVVAEDATSVVVYTTVCTSVAGEDGEHWEGPWHVYLDSPLGDREVIDGTTGRAVPYKNVWADIEDRVPGP